MLETAGWLAYDAFQKEAGKLVLLCRCGMGLYPLPLDTKMPDDEGTLARGESVFSDPAHFVIGRLLLRP